MALYAYRCDSGKEEILVVGTFEDHPAETVCEVHDSPAYRVFSTQGHYDHKLRSAYFVPLNAKTEDAFIKQEARRGHDVEKRRQFKP
jgi:hypothetical protein